MHFPQLRRAHYTVTHQEANTMKTSKFSSDFDLHLERDNTRRKWITQSAVVLLLLLVTTATIMVFHFTGKRTPKELQPPTAEKLVATEVITDQLKLQNDAPEGFKNELKGPHPSRFASATSSPVIITPRNPNYPKNIREIIDHLQGEGRTDPFHLYKPENPSDVNLLAVNNVRFAPPVWASLRSAAKRKAEDNSTVKLKGSSELSRSEIFPRGSEGGFPGTFVRLNVYSKRHKKRNPRIIFPSSK